MFSLLLFLPQIHTHTYQFDRGKCRINIFFFSFSSFLFFLLIVRLQKKSTTTIAVEVKKSQHKYVIGPKGNTLQEILEKTGVSVEIPPTDSSSETVILRGEPDRLGQALTEVYAKVIIIMHFICSALFIQNNLSATEPVHSKNIVLNSYLHYMMSEPDLL